MASAQQKFDKLYMTASEISEKLGGVHRVVIYRLAERGKLPTPISIGSSPKLPKLFERAEVEKVIDNLAKEFAECSSPK